MRGSSFLHRKLSHCPFRRAQFLDLFIGVMAKPGASALTQMPCGPHSTARPQVSAMTPALAGL
jgi:hypothetical protein